MDLVKLNANKQPGPLVEGYDSLIWTERFNTIGDFQLITGDIDRFMANLKKQTLLSLRESNVPMLVETHEIVREKTKPAKLTITGRAFESILDRRAAINGVVAAGPEWSVVAKIPSDVAYYAMVKICVEGVCDPADIFPASEVQFITPSDYLNTTGPNRQFIIPRGNLLSAVLGFIQTEYDEDILTVPPTPACPPHGIRSIRPNASGKQIGIQIYAGRDRSDSVIFDGSRDMLNDGRYLFSDVGSADAAYVIGANTAAKMHQGKTPATGFDRRVILVDASNSGVQNEEALRYEGSRAMSDAHVTSSFDGSINEDLSAYIYGVDYFLGDIVSLVGDYGLREKVRVTEFIRSYGPDGYKAFPTLTTVEEEKP